MATTEHLRANGGLTGSPWHRHPGGTGVIPRGMLAQRLFLASVCGLDPNDAVAAATGNTARLHGLPVGVIEPAGRPTWCSSGRSPVGGVRRSESFALATCPGVHGAGEANLVTGRSEQTPPTRRPALITHGAG